MWYHITKKKFQDKYLLNFLGFSFHGLMKLDDKIVGCYNVIPYEFIFFSENFEKIFFEMLKMLKKP